MFFAKSYRIIDPANLPYLSNLKVKYQLPKKMVYVTSLFIFHIFIYLNIPTFH